MPEQKRQDDPVCEHGTAMDVHCCGCHSGFLFDASSCRCLAPEQPVSDRLATIQHVWGEGSTDQAKEDEANLWESLRSEPYMARAVKDIRWLLEQLSDYRHAALSSDAALEQADLQIGALRAEQARLREGNEAFKHLMDHPNLRTLFGLIEDSGTPEADCYWGFVREWTAWRDHVVKLFEAPPPEDDGKSARDHRPAFSQVDLDAATKPLHAEIERLRAEIVEAPMMMLSAKWRDQAEQTPDMAIGLGYSHAIRLTLRSCADELERNCKSAGLVVEQLRAENERLKAAEDRTREYIKKAMYSGGVKAICGEGIYDRAQRAGLQHALNALNAEFAKVEAPST